MDAGNHIGTSGNGTGLLGRRLAIIGGGVDAIRVVHAVRELNESRSAPLRLIAICREVERHALFARECDEVVCPTRSEEPGVSDRASGPAGDHLRWLDPNALGRALSIARPDSVWIASQLVHRRHELSEICSRLGLTVVDHRVGPDGATDASSIAATAAGSTVAATAGAARDERGVRRLGVQIARDLSGGVQVLGVVESTLRRGADEIVVESPPVGLDEARERAIHETCIHLVEESDVPIVATVDVMYDPDDPDDTDAPDGGDARAEMRGGLGHQVIEMTTGVDLVKLAIRLADGGGLPLELPRPRGHAVEVVLRATDPARAFARSTGLIDRLRLPTGAGVRVDTALAEGDTVHGEADPAIARIAAWGPDRASALTTLRRALADTVAVVDGGTTNQGFLLDLLDHPDVATGNLDTTWIDREETERGFVPDRGAELALVQAAIEVAGELDTVEQTRFYGWARRGRPQIGIELGHTVELSHRANRYAFGVWRLGPSRWRVEVDGTRLEVDVDRLGRHERRLHVGGDTRRVVAWAQGADLLVSVDGISHRISREDVGLVRTPAPAVVVAITVAVGDEVRAGDAVAVVESMKMETVLRAPFTGRVHHVLVGVNVQVDAGTPVLRIDPIRETPDATSADRLSFAGIEGPAETDQAGLCERNHRIAEWLLLGYDVPDDDVERIASQERELCAQLGSDHPALIEGQNRLLSLFADLRSLTRSRDSREVEEHVRSSKEYLHAFLRSLDPEAEGLPHRYVELLKRVVRAYGIDDLSRTPALEEALYRAYRSLQREAPARMVVLAVLGARLEVTPSLVEVTGRELRDLLDTLIGATQVRDPVVADLARQVRYRYFDQPILDAARDATYAAIEPHIAALADPDAERDRGDHIGALVSCQQRLTQILTSRILSAPSLQRSALVEVMTRRFYRTRDLEPFDVRRVEGLELLTSRYGHDGVAHLVVASCIDLDSVGDAARAVADWVASLPDDGHERVQVDLYVTRPRAASPDELAAAFTSELAPVAFPSSLDRIVIAAPAPEDGAFEAVVDLFTFHRRSDGRLAEDLSQRGMHPMMAERLQLWRLANFDLERLPSIEDVYLYHATARDNPRDERLFAIAEVRDLMPMHDEVGRVVNLPELELVLSRAAEGIRQFQALRPPAKRLQWNRIILHVWSPIEFDPDEIRAVAGRLAPGIGGLGIEMTMVHGRVRDHRDGRLHDRVLRISSPAGTGVLIEVDDPPTQPLLPLDEYTRRVVQARARGTVYPYELIQMLAPPSPGAGLPRGEFHEYDLDASGDLVPVERPRGHNEASIVVGLLRSHTDRYPEGMVRVAMFGDPTRSLGAIAQPECRRISAALALAERLGAPVEWFAISAGARIAMDSGTENMDGVAAVLRDIVGFTQRGGEINVVVTGINVGAQPYWNAEATMLMHTRGILVMTPESAMVLTGKQALEYSGSVSAEDNFGIGGYERIMGPNGQAQYWARDLTSACRLLLSHYEHAYVAPGERFPRRARTDDPIDRDVCGYPHHVDGSDFTCVGDIFSAESNPDRKKSFDMRTLMAACCDRDHPTLERWPDMRGASTAVVWDAHLGGWPVTLIGIESRPLQRHGPVPADGPDQWTAGTLFPQSSKKVARAINTTSGNRPLVVLANLSGFDGSPESMRSLQLEFGAEIGRAIVNFDGPIVFCVVSRFHGGAFVVFSRRLNGDLEAVAVEGSRASVIGGAPAAAVVFSHEVDIRTHSDPRLEDLDERIANADDAEREQLRAERAALTTDIRADKLGELADEFDAVHSVERALGVGSIDAIIAPSDLRPYLVDAVERGINRTLGRLGSQG